MIWLLALSTIVNVIAITTVRRYAAILRRYQANEIHAGHQAMRAQDEAVRRINAQQAAVAAQAKRV